MQLFIIRSALVPLEFRTKADREERVYWVSSTAEGLEFVLDKTTLKLIEPHLALSGFSIWSKRPGNFNSLRNAIRSLRKYTKLNQIRNYRIIKLF